VGRPADVLVLDPAAVGAGPLRRVQDLPGGGERLICDAMGIDAVLVNGVVLRRNGSDQRGAHALPGKLLRGGCAAI
jgi:N-acyl-D-amino-acid deacylase